jgi:hypothetical protein
MKNQHFFLIQQKNYICKAGSDYFLHLLKQFIFFYKNKIASPFKLNGLFLNWVGVRLLLNANSAIFQLYHGENKLIFNEMMTKSALY